MTATYRIAVIAYGSLVWDQRGLSTEGPWSSDGPVLPIEFCRVARDGRLTLAVDHELGVDVTCSWAISGCDALADALEELRAREGMVDGADAGFVDLRTGERSYDYPYLDALAAWAEERGFDAVVWSALPTNLHLDGRGPYSVESAIAYARGLNGETARRAREYIVKAPIEVDTPLRRAITADGWLDADR